MRARTWVLRAGAVGVVAVLVVWLWGQFAPDPAVLLDGETRTSSSGRYTSEFLAEEINGRRNVYPVIKNSAGEVLWSDDRRYLMSAHPVGVVWQKDADVLWLLSDDIGTSRVVEKDGEWVKEWDWDTLPPDIEKIEKG
ncbi:hypothetical protein EGT56_07880 [Arachnia propionica]|jgi:hypothetical protein|uniref:hypothetical protein n=1 Tax=Arachnia propionica TaxID=1750 RepID=UPI0005A274F3|nr:hypothetical protein [Arachnia propionica]RPA17891.1 hypothetical protein EGT56_07880 [Arachnia propionica]